MLLSLSLIFLLGLSLSWIAGKIKLPSLIGFLLCGIILGPYLLNLIDETVLNISTELRQIALIIILIRAGLSLNIKDLKKIGRPALLMCFLPALFEIVAVAVFAPVFFGVSYLEALILGSVLAAVSPAVIVPRMIKMIDNKKGTDKGIPQLIMAGASVDDVFVIVLFTVFTALATGKTVMAWTFIDIPLSIIFGIAVGFLIGYLLSLVFKKISLRDSLKVVIVIAVAFLMVSAETLLKNFVAFSALLAVISMGVALLSKSADVAHTLSKKFSKLWIVAEIILFALVGASLDLSYFLSSFFVSMQILAVALAVRMAGVWFSLIRTNFNNREKLFCSIAYTPKATVQAAIGGLPLAMGLACGNLVLATAVVFILVTAPIGAALMDFSVNKLIK